MPGAERLPRVLDDVSDEKQTMRQVAIHALLGTTALLLAACGQSWPRYTNEALGFSISHPAGTEIRVEGEHSVRFRVPAPDAETTPGANGFTLTVRRATGVPIRASLGAYASAMARRSRARGKLVVSGPTRIKIGGHPAARYRYRTRLGDVATRYLFVPQTGRFYNITVVSRSKGQPARAKDMIASLRFSSDSKAAKVQVALLETPAPGAEPEAGCDMVVFETFTPPKPGKPLTMALEALFALHANKVRDHRNFIARTKRTLRLDHVVRAGHTARIYLMGKLSGLRGACDNPRAAIQIRQTALQVEGIKRVEIFLNGHPTDLQPNARGQPAQPGPRA